MVRYCRSYTLRLTIALVSRASPSTVVRAHLLAAQRTAHKLSIALFILESHMAGQTVLAGTGPLGGGRNRFSCQSGGIGEAAASSGREYWCFSDRPVVLP